MIAGFGSSIDFLLNKPTSLTFDGNARLYIVDSQNNRIVRLNVYLDVQVKNPQSISFDHFENIFITGSNHHRILQFHLINNSTKSIFLLFLNILSTNNVNLY